MSELILDTITGKSTATTITIGSTPVVSASATSMTIRGEGSAQTSIQQGLAKAWANFNGSGTVAFRDSFNASSLADDGSGLYTTSYSNNFSSINYSFTYCGGQSKAETTYQMGTANTVVGSHQIQLKNAAGSVTDRNYICGTFHGDLA